MRVYIKQYDSFWSASPDEWKQFVKEMSNELKPYNLDKRFRRLKNEPKHFDNYKKPLDWNKKDFQRELNYLENKTLINNKYL